MVAHLGLQGLQILWLTLITLSSESSPIQYKYPPRSLACKTYSKTHVDCSNRNLVEVPILDQNLTITLDLSANQLLEISGAPFQQLQVLLKLNLSSNEIRKLSVTAFRGLYSLKYLYLDHNKLTDLPKDVFTDLFNIFIIKLDFNWFESIPNQALSPLQSLEALVFSTPGEYGYISAIDLSGFQNLTNLRQLWLMLDLQTDIPCDAFQPLSLLPLQSFTFFWTWRSSYNIDKEIFAPLTKLTKLATSFSALSALISIQSPLHLLYIFNQAEMPPDILAVNKSSLQVLQKFNSSLNILKLYVVSLQQIDDYSFIWTPNVINLDLKDNEINHLAKHSLHGLRSLQQLTLNNNRLTKVPSQALEVFRTYGTLQHLDLSSNMIANSKIPDDAFSAVSSSLTYLNAGGQKTGKHVVIKWLSLFQKLNHISFPGNMKSGNFKVKLKTPVLSLQSLQINNADFLEFTPPFCFSFPNLEVAIILDSTFDSFPSNMALHKCSHLLHLDLSGSLENMSPPVELDHLNISISTLTILKIARNGVQSIKQATFIRAPMLTTLDLSYNSINSIDADIATAYPNLENLTIDDNGLESIAGLQGLLFLKKLSATQNQITSIPTWLTSIAEISHLTVLDLSYNPFQCTCDIEHFRKWILSDTNTWLQQGQYLCATPEALKGVSITGIELDCTSKTPMYLGIGFAIGILFCALLIILTKYRWHIKYKIFLLYRNYHPIANNIDDEFRELGLQYHAYVAYNDESAEDTAWVMDDLRPNMENGPEPLRLFIKARDMRPGNLIDMIDRNMNQSRKVVLVLSPNFVESEWCYHEMRTAHMRLLDHNLDVLVLVLIHDIPENKVTLSLRHLLCKKEYLKWPKGRAGQRLFWQRLRLEIKGPIHADRT